MPVIENWAAQRRRRSGLFHSTVALGSAPRRMALNIVCCSWRWNGIEFLCVNGRMVSGQLSLRRAAERFMAITRGNYDDECQGMGTPGGCMGEAGCEDQKWDTSIRLGFNVVYFLLPLGSYPVR